ncbi:DUF6817 domain-containing protein [Jeongeupia wiesaeckerbachi]
MGAGAFSHLNGSLEYPLRGTEALLHSCGASEQVCRAGLFHAAYVASFNGDVQAAHGLSLAAGRIGIVRRCDLPRV